MTWKEIMKHLEKRLKLCDKEFTHDVNKFIIYEGKWIEKLEKLCKAFEKELREKDREYRKFVGEKGITRISIKEILG